LSFGLIVKLGEVAPYRRFINIFLITSWQVDSEIGALSGAVTCRYANRADDAPRMSAEIAFDAMQYRPRRYVSPGQSEVINRVAAPISGGRANGKE
jgi:hypothetical protein